MFFLYVFIFLQLVKKNDNFVYVIVITNKSDI